MPAVVFQNGSRFEARTWRGLERQIRKDPWNRDRSAAFRREMAHRAVTWSATRISTEGSSRRFIAELERAGLLMIEEES